MFCATKYKVVDQEHRVNFTNSCNLTWTDIHHYYHFSYISSFLLLASITPVLLLRQGNREQPLKLVAFYLLNILCWKRAVVR